MKALLTLLLFGSCATREIPDWVRAVQSGEERLKVTNGEKLLYRNIGTTCPKAIRATERLIYKEYAEAVPVVELQFETESYCAVTMSIPAKSKRAIPKPLPKIGTSIAEYRMQTKEHVSIAYDYTSTCWKEFDKAGSTYHGASVICWKQLRIVGAYEID